MTEQAKTKVTKSTGSRHSIYLRSDLVNDSQFPFEPDQEVIVRIDGERLIVEAVE